MAAATHTMADLHIHLIPGVDDGAEDMMMALMMLLRAWDQGVREVFVTPHSSAFDEDPEKTKAGYRELVEQAKRNFPELKLFPGCEVYCEAYRMDQVIQALNCGLYPTMNGTGYVLMEFSRWVMPELTLPCVEALVKAGYIPIIAHMERYEYLQNHMNLVDRFLERGALLQVNAYSLRDELDEGIRNWARKLVLEQKVSFLGTDAHRTYHRPPSAEPGLRWLYEAVPEEYADAVARENARRLLMQEQEDTGSGSI